MKHTVAHRSLHASSLWTAGALVALVGLGCGSKDGGGGTTPGTAGTSSSGGGGTSPGAAGSAGTSGTAGGAGTTGAAGTSGGAGTTGAAGTSGGAGATGAADAGTAGTAATSDAGAADAAEVHPTGAPVFVAVGDNGATVRSLDLGKTWIDAKRLMTGEIYGFRTSTFAKGLFVAIGWQLYTSPDGKTWTMRKKGADQWMEGVRFGNGMFVAAGGYGQSTYSMDGITWPAGGLRMTDPARSVAFGNGVWVARADSGDWWQTADGKTWTDIGGGHGDDDVVFCGNAFADSKKCAMPVGRDGGRVAFGESVWLGVTDGKVERSEDGGTTWKTVTTPATDPLESVSFGYVAP